MDIGRKMIRKYLFLMKSSDNDSKDLNYSDWYSNKIKSNKLLVNKIENDEVIAYLGFSLIQILESCDMVISKLITQSKDEKYYTLTVDLNLLDRREKSLIDLPLKLPMIVKPKPYNSSSFGGYLLNNVRYCEDLIIKKKYY